MEGLKAEEASNNQQRKLAFDIKKVIDDFNEVFDKDEADYENNRKIQFLLMLSANYHNLKIPSSNLDLDLS